MRNLMNVITPCHSEHREESRTFVKTVVLMMLVAASAFAWPWSKDEPKIDSAKVRDSLKLVEYKELQREVDALTRIRLQKADSLEKLEAEHWRKRYNETQLTEEHQTETRKLDGRYSKLSTDLGRVNEEVMASKDVTTDAEEKAKSDESAYDALNTQIKLSVDKSLGEVTGDYPVGMNDRLVNLKKAQNDVDAKNPNTLSAARLYLGDLLKRHEMTYTQTVGSANSQVGSRPDVNVNRLRLGTVFLGEVATDGSAGGLGEVQALLRSGALQGKIFEWNSTLPQEMSATIRTAVSQASTQSNSGVPSGDASGNILIGGPQVTIPLDVLQNKAVKNSITDTKELSWKEELQAFFKKGGIVMYPLMLVALFALLLCLERFIVLTIRGRIGKRFVKKVETMVSEKRYDAAADLCLKKESSLSMVMFAVLNKAKETRDAAEKSLQEALLREQPKLERRMGLLAAMGSIAPLLGLLGTVTGIITLFNVITEVGTNDARVLAGGISEALVTTETGLIIAIPVMILHGLLSEKIEKVTSELYVQSTSLLNKIFPKEE